MWAFFGAIWQLIRDLLFSPAFWGFAGVMAGGWLTWRKEASLQRHERGRRMQFAAVSLSSSLARFINACADVASDDGTCMEQPDPEAVLRAQTKLPSIDYSCLKIDWRSLPIRTVDRLFQFQICVNDEHDRLKFEYALDDPPYDRYFFERRSAFVELGIEADSVARHLRAAVGLDPIPETRSLALLKERQSEFKRIVAKRAAADQLLP